MIVTLTPNTGIDYTVRVPGFEWGRTLRASQVAWGMGGKATDVSFILGKLRVPSLALGFAAGPNGVRMQAMLEARGVQTDFVWVEGDTRLNLIIARPDGEITTITSPTLLASPEHRQALERKYAAALAQATCEVIGGSLPLGFDPAWYTDLVHQARQRGIPVVFDAGGALLKAGLEGGASVVKPNAHELAELIGERVDDLAQIAGHARRLVEKYGSSVVVTLGSRGALAACGGQVYRVEPLTLKVVSPAGSGDGVLAGIALALSRGQPVEAGLQDGFALANAILLTLSTADFNLEDYERLLPQIQILPMKNI